MDLLKLSQIIQKCVRRIYKLFTKRILQKIQKKKLEASFQNSKGIVSSQIKIFYSNKHTNIFSELCDQYGSDKGGTRNQNPYPWPSHSYADFYSRIFERSRAQITKVFECGIGTNNANIPSNMTTTGIPGASLRVWKDYFPNAEVFGGDIDSNVLFQDGRIKTYFLDQLDPNSIENFWSNVNTRNFDLIVDDGLHSFESGLTLFVNSIDYLAENGMYVIEDVKISDMLRFKKFFDNSKYTVDYVLLERPKSALADNCLIVIKK